MADRCAVCRSIQQCIDAAVHCVRNQDSGQASTSGGLPSGDEAQAPPLIQPNVAVFLPKNTDVSTLSACLRSTQGVAPLCLERNKLNGVFKAATLYLSAL